MTTTQAEIGLGAKAADAELRAEAGDAVFLSSYWDEQPLVLVLLNNLRVEASAEHAITLRDAHQAFDQAGGAIVVVARNEPAEIASFRSERRIGYSILSDVAGEAHQAYGVPEGGSASFVIDTGGVVRYAQRGAGPLDMPSTWTIVDAVCGLTGETVERPDPTLLPTDTLSPRDEPMRSGLVTGAPLLPVDRANFVCGKCGNSTYEVAKLSTAGGWVSRIFNFQYRSFLAVVCTACNYAELYRAKSGRLANIADIVAGG
jgi:predicted nucleic-acid-binding Zn-ribbon protein/peroxiredoxin